ncbi:MAG: hypothetical protein HYW47_07560 [Deltaproteobacteria bacterium]|nr:hypothetical protein [Deltaproteobacteria bacterium]
MQFSTEEKGTEGHRSCDVGVQKPCPSQKLEGYQFGFSLKGETYDFYKTIESLVSDIYKKIGLNQNKVFDLNPSRKKTILLELEALSFKLFRRKLDWQFREEELFESKEKQEVFSLYLYRTCYFNLAKICLLKYWLHLGIIHEEDLRTDYHLLISKKLFQIEANLIAQRQIWLFSKQNAYSWLRFSEEDIKHYWKILEDTKLRENPHHFIPQIFEHFCQCFADPLKIKTLSIPLVEFIGKQIERGGLVRKVGHYEKTKSILNLCAGSGQFLSEFAAIIKKTVSNSHLQFEFLTEHFTAIEKDLFSFYFLEMTLVWEMSDIQSFKRGSLLHYHPFRLVHQNNIPGTLDTQLLTEEESFANIEHPQGDCKKIYDFVKNTQKVDFTIVCTSKQNESDLKTYMEIYPELKAFYETDMIASSWYYMIGLSKLREGGKLFALSDEYWPRLLGAKKLRRYLLEHSKVLCIFDLGVHLSPRYLFVFEKCQNKEERDSHRIKLCKLKSTFNFEDLNYVDKAIQEVCEVGSLISDDRMEIFFGPVLQQDLSETPWSSLEEFTYVPILKKIRDKKPPLSSLFTVKNPNLFQQEEDENLLNLIPTDKVGVLGTDFQYQRSDLELKKDFQFFIYQKASHVLTPKLLNIVLNSKLLKFWYKTQCLSAVSRKSFTQSDLYQIPLPSCESSKIQENFSEEKIGQFFAAIGRRDASYLEAGLLLELKYGNTQVVYEMMQKLFDEECRVEEQIKKYLDFQTEGKTNWKRIKDIFTLQEQSPLQNHPHVFVEMDCKDIKNFCFLKARRLKHPESEEDFLQIISLDSQFLKIFADSVYLSILEAELEGRENLYWDEMEQGIYLPKDLKVFLGFKDEIFQKWMELEKWKGDIFRILNQLVFRLYGFDPEDNNQFSAQESSKFIEIISQSVQ